MEFFNELPQPEGRGLLYNVILKDADSMPDKKDNSIRFLFSLPYDDRYYSIERMKRLIMKKKNKVILLQNLK